MNQKAIDLVRKEFPDRSFSTQEALNKGVSNRMLTYLSKKGLIERVGRGLYTLTDYDSNDDFQFMDLAHASKSYKGSAICLLSALSYWELTDEIPRQYWLAIPNNQPTPKTDKKIKFYRPRNLKDGIVEKCISGEKIKITSPERSVAESFKYYDEETGIHALEFYLHQETSKINLKELLDIAQKLKSKKLIDMLRKITLSQAKNYPQLNQKALTEVISWLSEKRNIK